MADFKTNDVVKRKSDASGRTRRVIHVQRDADGTRHVLLDQPLDGWQVWNENALELVTRPPTRVERLAHLLHRRHA